MAAPFEQGHINCSGQLANRYFLATVAIANMCNITLCRYDIFLLPVTIIEIVFSIAIRINFMTQLP